MKKFALVFLIIAGLAACSEHGGQKQNIAEKEKSLSAKNDTAFNKTGKNEEVISPGRATLVDIATAKKAYNKGIELYGSGKLKAALEQFKTVLGNNPKNSMALHYMGRIYFDMGDKKKALSYYKDAARNNINDSVSVLGIGQIYFDMGDKKNAMEYYNMSLEIGPHFALAYYNRGTLFGMQNQYQKALDDLNKSIQYDSTNGNAYINRGLAHYYLKNLDLACKDWQKAADMGLKQGKDAVDMYCRKRK